jgi:hypothetical protein
MPKPLRSDQLHGTKANTESDGRVLSAHLDTKPVNERNLLQEHEYLRNFGVELGAQTCTLLLVPDLSCSDIEFGSATDLDVEVQRSNRSSRLFTSDHEL